MLINSATADAIVAGQRDNLRQVDRHGNDTGPIASGEPTAIWCFTDDDGKVRFGLVLKNAPAGRETKYSQKDNAFLIWSAP